MDFIIFTEQEKSDRRQELLEMTVYSDREFVPPLSERTSTVQKDLAGGTHDPAGVTAYFNEMMAQKIIAAVEDGKVAAFLSFRENYTNDEIGEETFPNLYLSTMISRPESRGKGIGGRIFRHLFQDFYPENRVYTRTWSTNDVQLHVFRKLGFQETLRVKDGRGPGIDTVYFEKPSEYDNPASPLWRPQDTRAAVIDCISSEYGAEPERLWQAYPDYIVFRHQDNRKWFAIIMTIGKEKLGIDEPGWIDVINLKIEDPFFRDFLLGKEGYFPAYHMNKQNWITVALDGTVPFAEVREMVGRSFENTERKRKAR